MKWPPEGVNEFPLAAQAPPGRTIRHCTRSRIVASTDGFLSARESWFLPIPGPTTAP